MQAITYASLLVSVICISAAQILAKARLGHYGPMPSDRHLPNYLWVLIKDAPMWGVVAIAAVGAFCWYFSLSRTPLTTAIYFLILIYPMMTIGGVFFLGEKVGAMPAVGMSLMLIGMFVLLRTSSHL